MQAFFTSCDADGRSSAAGAVTARHPLRQSRGSHWADACQVDLRTLNQLMAEVEDPALRATVLRLCVAVAEADEHVADGESIVLVSAVEQWGLHHEMLRASRPADSH